VSRSEAVDRIRRRRTADSVLGWLHSLDWVAERRAPGSGRWLRSG